MFKLKRISLSVLSFLLSILFLFSFSLITPIGKVYVASCSAGEELCIKESSPIKRFFDSIFNVKTNENYFDSSEPTEVYVGGIPLGFALACDGAVIVGTSEVLTQNGAMNPTQNSNIKPGDILYKIEDKVVTDANFIEKIVNSKENAGRELKVTILRNGQEFITSVYPALDKFTQSFKLGLWVRDDGAGVGTLSYVRADNLRFGALGHPVCDIDTGSILPISSGQIYSCDIIGVKKGERGSAGELKGLFLRGGQTIGTLDNNTSFGVFGQFDGEVLNDLNLEKMLVASPGEVKLGKATLRCTTINQTPQDYSLEIIKTTQSATDAKNMVIRITDPDLLMRTGGIVQGMSGSPIIQNNKLIGVVTHVFVSDPTKGFASFVTNMIQS